MRFKKINWYVVVVILTLGKTKAIIKRQDVINVPGYGPFNTNYDAFNVVVPDHAQTYQNYYQTPLQQQYSDSINYNAYVVAPSTFLQGNAGAASNGHWTMASNDWVPGYFQNPQINLNSNTDVTQAQTNSIYSLNFDPPSTQPFMFGMPIMTQSSDNSVVPMYTPVQSPIIDLKNATNTMNNLEDAQSTQFGYDLATPSFSTTPIYDGLSIYNSESYPSNTPSEEMPTNQQFRYYENSMQNFDNMAQTYQTPGLNYNAEAPEGHGNSLYDNNFSPAENTQYYTYDRPNDNSIPPLPTPVEAPLIDLTNAKETSGLSHSGKPQEQGYVLSMPSSTTTSANDGLNYPTHKNYRSPNDPPIYITTDMPKREESKSAHPFSPPSQIPENFGWTFSEGHKNYKFVPYLHKCYVYKENILFTRKRCVPIYYQRKPKPSYVPPTSPKKHSTTKKTSAKDEDKKDKQIPASYYRQKPESSYLPPKYDEKPKGDSKKKKPVKVKMERTTVGQNLCKSLLPSAISMLLCGS